jgi:hypothetical protein
MKIWVLLITSLLIEQNTIAQTSVIPEASIPHQFLSPVVIEAKKTNGKLFIDLTDQFVTGDQVPQQIGQTCHVMTTAQLLESYCYRETNKHIPVDRANIFIPALMSNLDYFGVRSPDLLSGGKAIDNLKTVAKGDVCIEHPTAFQKNFSAILDALQTEYEKSDDYTKFNSYSDGTMEQIKNIKERLIKLRLDPEVQKVEQSDRVIALRTEYEKLTQRIERPDSSWGQMRKLKRLWKIQSELATLYPQDKNAFGLEVTLSGLQIVAGVYGQMYDVRSKIGMLGDVLSDRSINKTDPEMLKKTKEMITNSFVPSSVDWPQSCIPNDDELVELKDPSTTDMINALRNGSPIECGVSATILKSRKVVYQKKYADHSIMISGVRQTSKKDFEFLVRDSGGLTPTSKWVRYPQDLDGCSEITYIQ